MQRAALTLHDNAYALWYHRVGDHRRIVDARVLCAQAEQWAVIQSAFGTDFIAVFLEGNCCSLFPTPLHPLVTPLANFCYALAVRAHLVQPSIRRLVDVRTGPQLLSTSVTDPDAERRR